MYSNSYHLPVSSHINLPVRLIVSSKSQFGISNFAMLLKLFDSEINPEWLLTHYNVKENTFPENHILSVIIETLSIRTNIKKT